MDEKEVLSQYRRQQIHAAALTCFARKGYHLATMDEIAFESGLSKGTLYWYFPSKKELFISLLDDTMKQFGDEWQVLVDASDVGAIAKLEMSLAFFKTEMVKMSPLVDILLEAWAMLRHDEEIAERLRKFYVPFTDLMAGIIEEGMEEGVFDVVNPSVSAMVIVTLFDGIMLAISTGLDLGDWERILDSAEEMILRGLGVKGEIVV
jgi:AcrR family transcriptional regulator